MGQRSPVATQWAVASAVLAVVFFNPGNLAAREPTKFALLVGVDDYSELTDLSCAGNDERAFAKVLRELGFPADQVVLLVDRATQPRYLPFRENIVRQLELLLSMPEADDLLIVGFSGHGVAIDGKSYLCPTGARVEEPETMIAVDWIYERLEKCPAALKLLFVDACRHGDPRPPGLRAAPARGLDLFQPEPPPKGVMILNSCGANQYAREDKEKLQHGVFMHFILEGLHGKADNGRGLVTLSSLYDYASLETKKYVRNHWNSLQTPALEGRIDGPFEICRFERARVETPAGPQPGDVTTNSIGMKLVLIPAGEFMMGGDESAAELKVAGFGFSDSFQCNDERPKHRVRIARPFYMGVYEVTKAQFAQFVTATDYKTEAENDGKGGGGVTGDVFKQSAEFNWRSWGVDQSDQSPVVNVSWNDAVAYCGWLSRQDGRRHRLPTEAEWEYACRAGTTSRFFNGDDPEGLVRVGNVADGSAKAKFNAAFTTSASDGYAFTSPVGRFRPNAFGLYDMHGNTFEWCSDWYAEDYYAASPVDDPQGPPAGSFRVLRGGGWRNDPVYCRSASRSLVSPANRSYLTGFRVVCAR
ncbi:MAG TPA: SUMF1/EgtB/PvdO family nonheme iron enzyme [Pirellulales bacterium]